MNHNEIHFLSDVLPFLEGAAERLIAAGFVVQPRNKIMPVLRAEFSDSQLYAGTVSYYGEDRPVLIQIGTGTLLSFVIQLPHAPIGPRRAHIMQAVTGALDLSPDDFVQFWMEKGSSIYEPYLEIMVIATSHLERILREGGPAVSRVIEISNLLGERLPEAPSLTEQAGAWIAILKRPTVEVDQRRVLYLPCASRDDGIAYARTRLGATSDVNQHGNLHCMTIKEGESRLLVIVRDIPKGVDPFLYPI